MTEEPEIQVRRGLLSGTAGWFYIDDCQSIIPVFSGIILPAGERRGSTETGGLKAVPSGIPEVCFSDELYGRMMVPRLT